MAKLADACDDTRLTASLPTTPVSVPKLEMVALVVPSYTLLAAVRPLSVRDFGVMVALVLVSLRKAEQVSGLLDL